MGRKLRPLQNDGGSERDAWLEKLQFLSDAMESTSQPFGASWPDGRLFLCNDAFCELTGYTKEELLNNSTLSVDLTLSERRECKVDALLELHKPGKPQRYEKAYIRKDGTKITVEPLVHQALDSAGNVLIYYSFITDITERKRAENALRLSDERRDFSLQSADIGAWDLNLIDHTAWRSLCHDQIFGYNAQLPEWTYEMFLSHVLPEDRDLVDNNFQNAVSGHNDWDFECRIRRSDGEVRWMWGHGRAVYDEKGLPMRMYGINIDIDERKRTEEELHRAREGLEITVQERTAELERSNKYLQAMIEERKQAEEVLQKNEEMLRRVIDTSPVPMVLHNEAGNVLYLNKKFTETFGYTIEDIPSLTAWWTHAYPDEEYREFVKKRWFIAIDYAIKNNARIDPRDVDVTCKDGSIRHILSEFSSIGNINLSILYDITERKRVEEELNEAKLQAELYLDLMGHDISNMHQIAISQLELAKEIMNEEGGLKTGEKELIETPLETLNRSARLIENVRNLQKMKGGEFKEEKIDLNDLLASIVKEYEPMVPANSIKFVSNVSCCVMANKLLHDVFSNLVGNAIKHSNGNDIDINVKLEGVSEIGKNYYHISVEDNGQGVPDELKDKIFNRLQRGETKARGLGLGLYLVKSLVDGYHGKVWVEDRIGGDHTKGARFVVLLPAMEDVTDY